MAYYVWSAAVPLSLYVTRGVGTTVRETLLRRSAPEPLDTSIDTAAALTFAAAALSLKMPIRIVSPTLAHLRELVQTGKDDLESLLLECQQRQHRRSLSRLFRQPCYREENARLRAAVETLESRVHLYASMLPLFNDLDSSADEMPRSTGLQPTLKKGMLAETSSQLARVFAQVVRQEFADSSDESEHED